MKTCDIAVNRLPVLTWNRLRMNNAVVSGVTLPQQGSIRAAGSALPAAEPLPDAFRDIPTGCGAELTALLADGGVQPAVLRAEGLTRLTFAFDADASAGHQLCLSVGADRSAVVLMDFTGPADAAGQGIVQTLIDLAPRARLHLVQVQRVGSGYTFFNDIGARCGAEAELTVTQLILSGARSYAGCEADLRGDGSRFDASAAYALAGSETLDLNDVVRHRGRRTLSNIEVNGSLRGRSAKLFRGTIDFIRGSAGAVGGERESVLLIDDGCINRTIPLILCEEEDVEGNHGASIGRPDEEVLFYLSSRGIPEEEACALLIRAKLDAAAGRIPDPEFRQEILDFIKGGAANG